jgi:hypothetical protein
MPAQLVKRFALGILLRCDDLLMLGHGDGPFLFETHRGPLPPWNHRRRQPIHVQREVVHPA